MSSLTGVKRPWLDEPVRTSSDGPQSDGPEDLSTNSERSSFSVSPSPSETATVPGTFGKFARISDRIMQPRLESPKMQSSSPPPRPTTTTTPESDGLEPELRFREQLKRFGVTDSEEDPSSPLEDRTGDFKSRARSWLRAKKHSRCQLTEIISTPFDLSTKRQRLSSVSSDGSPTFRLPRAPLSPSTPLIPPMIAPLLDPWNPLLYPLPALYYSSLCANLSAQTFRPQILTHEKPQDAVVPSWETVSHNNNNNNHNNNNNNGSGVGGGGGGGTKLTVKKEPEDDARSPAGSNRFTCDDCQKSYSTFAGLSKHKEFHCVNSASGRKEFCCKYCSKSYVSMGALKMHIRTHTLPCKCDICGKAFSRPWLLQGHIRTHTGEKPFECEHCHRAFADRSNLRAHLQTHQEVKKYSCARCSKTFSRMSLLQKHQDSMSCVASRSESSLSSRSSS